MADFLTAPGYEVARLILQRGVAIAYLLGFVNALNQFSALLGERGLLPVPAFLRHTSFSRAPSIFHWHYSDRFLQVVAWVGVILSLGLAAGLADLLPLAATILVWLVLWALYLSIINVGQTFYGFGWESLLVEAGFYAAFLGKSSIAPPLLVLWIFRWLLFRVELGAGLIKLRGDRCWRQLTCLDYHHETQPLPNPLSWWFHHLPRPLHRVEVAANHVAQLVAPFGLLLPQPVAGIAAGLMILTQGYLLVSGNYAWLNALTMVIAFAAIPDGFYQALLGYRSMDVMAAPAWFHVVVGMVAVLVVALSWPALRNLFSQRQLMNFAFNRFHLVNPYGAFGTVTRDRYEVVLEGTDAETIDENAEWREYGFKAKPGDPRRRPPQVAPYHLRLDWMMWFAALSPNYARGWFTPLVKRLLQGDEQTLRLLRHNPFPEAPPRHLRARLFHYRFTTPPERRSSGRWWEREPVGKFLPPVRLGPGGEPYRA